MLYGLIMERMGMYQKNNWKDEQGRVFVVYPVKEIMDDMNSSENSVKKYMAELEDAGLLERRELACQRLCIPQSISAIFALKQKRYQKR